MLTTPSLHLALPPFSCPALPCLTPYRTHYYYYYYYYYYLYSYLPTQTADSSQHLGVSPHPPPTEFVQGSRPLPSSVSSKSVLASQKGHLQHGVGCGCRIASAGTHTPLFASCAPGPGAPSGGLRGVQLLRTLLAVGRAGSSRIFEDI